MSNWQSTHVVFMSFVFVVVVPLRVTTLTSFNNVRIQKKPILLMLTVSDVKAVAYGFNKEIT